MDTNYFEAARRHFRDADALHGQGCLPNADHLFGIAAECALKAMIVGRAARKKGGVVADAHRVHIDKLWGQFQAHAAARARLAPYATMVPPQNPFAQWRSGQRYFRDASKHFSEGNVKTHKAAARRVMQMLDQAELSGFFR